MNNNKIYKNIAVVLCSALLFLSVPFETKADEPSILIWNYEYNGTEQTFTAPYLGKYQFELNGAQGGNYANYSGGKGGKVTLTLFLNRGDIVEIYVGGQDGYNGGGTGKISAGGGATDIRINGERVAIAGGGGGATAKKDGGEGGASSSGNNKTLYQGTSSTSSGTAGGGGGYIGGTAGRVVFHTHSGTAGQDGGCYHIHSSSCTHTHNDNCKEQCGGSLMPVLIGGAVTAYQSQCRSCLHTGQIGPTSESGACYGTCTQRVGDYVCGKSEGQNTCGKSEGLICGKTAGVTVESNTVSYGGSNWYDDSLCSECECEEGVCEGNGSCNVKILSLYNLFYQNTECINVYYKGIKAKKVYYNGILVYQE